MNHYYYNELYLTVTILTKLFLKIWTPEKFL